MRSLSVRCGTAIPKCLYPSYSRCALSIWYFCMCCSNSNRCGTVWRLTGLTSYHHACCRALTHAVLWPHGTTMRRAAGAIRERLSQRSRLNDKNVCVCVCGLVLLLLLLYCGSRCPFPSTAPTHDKTAALSLSLSVHLDLYTMYCSKYIHFLICGYARDCTTRNHHQH